MTRYLHNVNVDRFNQLETRVTTLEVYARIAAWGAGIGCSFLAVLVAQGFMR